MDPLTRLACWRFWQIWAQFDFSDCVDAYRFASAGNAIATWGGAALGTPGAAEVGGRGWARGDAAKGAGGDRRGEMGSGPGAERLACRVARTSVWGGVFR